VGRKGLDLADVTTGFLWGMVVASLQEDNPMKYEVNTPAAILFWTCLIAAMAYLLPMTNVGI
jgi:hypothetical protein